MLDPFCGSGTTILTSLEMQRNAIGIDRNPLAFVLSKAKADPPDLTEVMARLDFLEERFKQETPNVDEMPVKLVPFFHRWVFAQLVHLRSHLGKDRVDTFIKALIVGILHGRSRKTRAGSIYLSVDMPNTFSMSPAYVAGYVERHSLRRPPYDVFANTKRRAQSLLRGVTSRLQGTVLLADATQISSLLGPMIVDLVVTSPPYLGLLRYGAFNWLRLWFLDEDAAEIDRRLDSTGSMERYESFMLSFLCDLAIVSKPGSHAVLVVGELKRQRTGSLAKSLIRNVAPLTPWSVVALISDQSIRDRKTTRIWGDVKKGNASDRDEILVLRRSSSSDVDAAKSADALAER